MRKVEMYDVTKTYVSPVGELQPPEYWLERCPAIGLGIPFVVETDQEGIIALSVPQPLAHFKAIYDIDSTLPESLSISALEEVYNTPPPELEPGPEERIAAALEFQNAVTMLDMGLAIEPLIVAKNYERKLWSAEQAVLALGEAAKSIGVLEKDYNNIIQVLEAKEAKEVIVKGAE